MNKIILEDFRSRLNLSSIPTGNKELDCSSFLNLSEKFLLSSNSLNTGLAESVFNTILEIVAKEEDTYSSEEVQFYNLIESYCERKTNSSPETRKPTRVNRNLSRIAKRRWIRYREKYKRAIKRAQESFENKPCQKNIKSLLKKESFDRGDVYCLIKAMNSSLTHYLIYNELSEKTQDSQLPQELLEELNELNFNLFKESVSQLDKPELLSEEIQDLVVFANEVFCDCDEITVFNS